MQYKLLLFACLVGPDSRNFGGLLKLNCSMLFTLTQYEWQRVGFNTVLDYRDLLTNIYRVTYEGSLENNS